MSRKSILIALGIVTLLIAVVGTTFALLLRHEPAFYREVESSANTNRRQHSREFVDQANSLLRMLKEDRKWGAEFTDEQINCYLADGFRNTGLAEKMLPEDIADPRVRIEGDRLRFGFRYGSGWRSTIVSADFRAWVATGEPNVVALELLGMHAGALPISAQSLLEHVSDSARNQGIEVVWYRFRGHPTALLRFQGRRSRTSVQLERLELDSGRLLLQGCSVDAAPERAAPGPVTAGE